MAARIFISYRTSDGIDKATALARELGALFGDAQVFIDKDDLRGGAVWRREVAQALGERPVLLLLVTPQLLGAIDAAGRARIDDLDDPVRRELAAALDAGAHVIPVLADGVDRLPDPALLPAPFDRIGERTWRRLRAYDWRHDMQRLVDDLRALGVDADGNGDGDGASKPLSTASADAATTSAAARRGRRAWRIGVPVALVVVVAAGGGAAWWIGRDQPPASLSGEWELTGSGDAPLRLTLRHDGSRVELRSRPFSVASRPDWADYRAFWRERFHDELGEVYYRGDGLVETPPGAARAVDLAVQIVEAAGGTAVDGGNLHVAVDAAGERLTGTLWLNSAQAERAVVLRRLR